MTSLPSYTGAAGLVARIHNRLRRFCESLFPVWSAQRSAQGGYAAATNNMAMCCKAGWKLCLVGSRSTHDAERKYAPIEGEALAIAYTLHQTRYYILGRSDLTVVTDHKPLVGILNDRSLTDIDNRRLLNLKEKTL